MIYHFNKTNPKKNKHLKIKSVVKGLPLFFGNYYLKLFRVGCYNSALIILIFKTK